MAEGDNREVEKDGFVENGSPLPEAGQQTTLSGRGLF